MSPNRRSLPLAIALLVLLAAVAGVLLAADVWVATSRADTASTVSTASVGNATVGTPRRVVLYVAGDDRLAAATATHATRELGARGIQANRTTELRADYDAPLLVAVVSAETNYDPVTPSATVRVYTLYSTSGNVTQFGTADGSFSADRVTSRLRSDGFTTVHSSDEYPLVRFGEYTTTDRTRGVVSRPAYRRHVAELAGEAVARTLAA